MNVGHTCPSCGWFVGPSSVHYCRANQTTPMTTMTVPPRLTDVRIADALERIAGALERLAVEREA